MGDGHPFTVLSLVGGRLSVLSQFRLVFGLLASETWNKFSENLAKVLPTPNLPGRQRPSAFCTIYVIEGGLSQWIPTERDGLAANPIPNGSVSTVRAWPRQFVRGQRSAGSTGHNVGSEIGQLGSSADCSRDSRHLTCLSADGTAQIVGELFRASVQRKRFGCCVGSVSEDRTYRVLNAPFKSIARCFRLDQAGLHTFL